MWLAFGGHQWACTMLHLALDSKSGHVAMVSFIQSSRVKWCHLEGAVVQPDVGMKVCSVWARSQQESLQRFRRYLKWGRVYPRVCVSLSKYRTRIASRLSVFRSVLSSTITVSGPSRHRFIAISVAVGARQRRPIWVVFVRLHRKALAMALSGKSRRTRSVKWSETFAERLCSATKNENSTSAVVIDSGTSTDCRLKNVVIGACRAELFTLVACSFIFKCSLAS